ncbi:IclR family transcriptional regulator [Phytomonospora endophytica]|uniref:DNA-binding IclR family transcriptional regulator n=1 Tax=Phytomonospora endophytica TaxID=714109 RepID=A0A841FTP7_9ACTN|nr:IclR family transcriptional regulator C-terminal domain-containing protein [Phytomonospora endophytica]MBB6037108.1 DNA-binding IclR family transcriptional regulator [Phytomonospora endophytica]
MTGGLKARNEGKPSDFIQSVSRALRILEVVGSSRGGLTIKQIARRVQLAPTTTYHLVRTLTYENYLIRGEHGLFTVGLAVSDRFRDMSATMRGPSTVLEALRRQVADSGYSHYLARFVDGRVAITEVSEGQLSPHTEDLIIGFDDGAHATALGKALLATLTPTERRGYLRESGMRRYTSRTLTTLADFEIDLSRLSTQGVFTETGQYREGIACAATLVNREAPLTERLTVACAIPMDDLPKAAPDLRARLRVTAREVGAALAAAEDGKERP